MRSLYIVNTPFQLLTAYIIAKGYDGNAQKHLMLMTPKNYPSWEKSECLRFLSSGGNTWDGVSLLTSEWARKQMKGRSVFRKTRILKAAAERLRTEILSVGSVNDVYLGSDKLLSNQLLTDLVGCDSYIRFDEGTGSYIPQKRKWTTQAGQRFAVAFLRRYLGMTSRLQYNHRYIGAGLSGKADYLYQPALLQRRSPLIYTIEKKVIQKSLDMLREHLPIYPELQHGEIVLCLGRIEGENIAEVLSILKLLCEEAKRRRMRFIYKPHPGESTDMLYFYKQKLPGMEFFMSCEPIEVILHRHGNIRYIVSLVSSGLIYGRCFSEKKVRGISLLDLIKSRKIHDAYDRYKKILVPAGVDMPSCEEELRQLLSM